MGWGKSFLLGDLSETLDIKSHRLDTRVHRWGTFAELNAQQFAETKTEKYIEELFKENRELYVCLGAVIQLLIAKGTVTRDEISRLMDGIEQSIAKPEIVTDKELSDTASELEDLAKAVQETDHR